MRHVLFLQSRFPSSDLELNNLIARWNGYQTQLLKENPLGLLHIGVLCKSPKVVLEALNFNSLNCVNIKSTNGSFTFNFIQFFSLIKSSKELYTFVCGDNHKSFLFAFSLKLIFKKRIRIQIQFHGDTYTFGNNPGLKGGIRVFGSRVAAYFSDSIRVVSKFQLREISSLLKINQGKFVVAPIQIDPNKLSAIEDFKTRNGVIVVGRLHAERGVLEMLEIISDYCTQESSKNVTIVGEGPLGQLVRNRLSSLIESGKVTLINQLNPSDMKKLYLTKEILLSSAPAEGYGLSVREALLNGMYVVARSSEGVREASQLFTEQIDFYDSSYQALNSLLRPRGMVDPNYLGTVRKKQEEIDSNSMKSLIHSWIQY